MSDARKIETEPLLTDAEHQVIRLAADLWNALCAAVPDGPTRSADMGELCGHIHAIQHAVMANAAARAFPDLYRRLGSTIESSTFEQSREEVP